MKLFGRTGGYYMFWTGAVYLVIGLTGAAYFKEVPAELIQACWIIVLALPFLVPPVGRYFNMSIEWDKKMFNWFSKKGTDNVVEFPALKSVPATPVVEPPKKEEPAKIFYRLGLTDNNRVAFSMGYSEITMSHGGCQQMIDQLKFFQSQLHEDEGPDGDPDGGEPIPVPEQRAA